MAAIICYLVLAFGFAIAASLNYRRSLLTGKESLRLHQLANEAHAKAQHQYSEALMMHQLARQAKEEADKMLENVQQ